jgi:hypothetical protein
VPNVERVAVPKAWHFVFMNTPNMPLPSSDGPIGANPPRFDRAALLEGMGRVLTAFLDWSVQVSSARLFEAGVWQAQA